MRSPDASTGQDYGETQRIVKHVGWRGYVSKEWRSRFRSYIMLKSASEEEWIDGIKGW